MTAQKDKEVNAVLAGEMWHRLELFSEANPTIFSRFPSKTSFWKPARSFFRRARRSSGFINLCLPTSTSSDFWKTLT